MAESTPNVTWKAIGLQICISIPMGVGFQYLVDRTFANGFGAGMIVVWAAVGIVPFLLALRGRSSTPSTEAKTSLDETMRVLVLPWYKQPYQWFLASFFGSKTFMQAIDAGQGWKSATLQGFGTLAFLFLLMAVVIPLYPPPNFDRPSILKQSDKPS